MTPNDTDAPASVADPEAKIAASAAATNNTTAAPKSTRSLSLRTLLTFLGFALGGAGIGALGAHFGGQRELVHALLGDVSAFGVLDLLLLPLYVFLVILLHELGHLAGGKARGMRFLLLIVGPRRRRRTGWGV